MSDELTISGGSSIAVATDELFASAQALGDLAAEAAALRVRLATIDRYLTLDQLEAAGAPTGAARAEDDIDGARSKLAELEGDARAVQWVLTTAAERYGYVEQVVDRLGQELAGGVGWLIGRFLPVVGGIALPGLVGLAGGFALAALLSPGGFRQLMKRNNWLLTNPATATLVRNAAMSVDDAILGAAGVPAFVGPAIAPVGLAFTAYTLLRPGVGGVLTETPVRLASSTSLPSPAAPAIGFAERLARVPDPDVNGGAQVVVERYSTPGQPDRFEVFVAGTVTFSPVADAEPWDMTSNIANAAGAGSGSYEAVVEAMRLAGVGAESPVQFTGYSQGGAVVGRLAASGDYNTQGVVTFGAPVGQMQLPSDIPVVLVSHTDDIVPPLGGPNVSRHAVIVEREAFGGREIPQDYAVPAHHYEYYQETAQLMDEARSDQLRDPIERLDAFSAGATSVTSTSYRFERVSAP
ncbi:MAG: hypothetical protein JWP85_371 [Rhodoglobus sp.]|nr:hypothetical protein [Rhodoglobus sp.]